MRIATTASVALLALSTAALAQVAGTPAGPQTTTNNMMGSNTTMPDATMPDTTMNSAMPMDNGVMPDNGSVPPGE